MNNYGVVHLTKVQQYTSGSMQGMNQAPIA